MKDIVTAERFKQLYDERRFEELIHLCDELLSMEKQKTYPDPFYLEALLMVKANTLYTLQRYEEALAVYRDALNENPANSDALARSFKILVAGKRFSEARDLPNTALMGPQDEAAMCEVLAWFLMEQCRYDEALRTANRAQELDPTSPSSCYLQLEILCRLGKTRKALKIGKRALPMLDQHARFFPQLLAMVAALHGDVGELRKALSMYEEALSREQEMWQKSKEEERSEEEDAFHTDTISLIFGNMGWIWLLLTDTAKAKTYLDQALALGPNETFEAHREFAQVFMQYPPDTLNGIAWRILCFWIWLSCRLS